MKTKAEARKNPSKGDTWELGDWRRIIRERVKHPCDSDRDAIYYRGHGRECRCSYRTFRRWAAGAEYLGGGE
jgi:hypothetical protein